MVNVLLIFKDEVPKRAANKILGEYYRDQVKILQLSSLEEAIHQLQTKKTLFDIIILEHHHSSLDREKTLFSMGNGAAFVMYGDDQVDISSLQQEYSVEQIPSVDLEVNLPNVIRRFEVLGYLLPAASAIDEYISVRAEIVASYCPLNNDVYIKLMDGRFVKLFHKGDPIEREDFDRYQREKGVAEFFFKKSDHREILAKLVSKIDSISNTEPMFEEKALIEAIKTHDVLKDFVKQMGFTPEAQQVAKSCVAMTIKLLSAKPKLSKILNDLQRKDGNYVSSHSISLGTLACAIAHKMDWISSATYFKLSLAAFIHDITLDDQLARVQSLKDATVSGEFTADDLAHIKLHPIHAADYVRKMSEIPGDVDQIVFQHHERPDGSGFPRSLSGRHISPLSSVFIIAHDLIHFMSKREGESIETFLNETEELFKQGTFRKIWLALKADIKSEHG